MAVAEIIGAAVGILLLVVVAYLLVGGTLSTAETVVTAQKDITLLQESRLRTHVSIDSVSTSGDGTIVFKIINDGDEPISEISQIDFFSYNTTNREYRHYTYNSEGTSVPETWHVTSFENAVIHSSQLDPGVTMNGVAILADGDVPHNLQIVTPNGVSAEKII